MGDSEDNVGSDDINNMINLSQQEIGYSGQIDQLMGSIDASSVSSQYGDYCGLRDQLKDKVSLGQGGTVTRAQFDEWNNQLRAAIDGRHALVQALKQLYLGKLQQEQTAANDLRSQLRDKADRADKVRQAMADAQLAGDMVSAVMLVHDTIHALDAGLSYFDEFSDPTAWGLQVGASVSAAEAVESGVQALGSYSVEEEAVLQGWGGVADMQEDINTSISALKDQFKAVQADAASLGRIDQLPDDQ